MYLEQSPGLGLQPDRQADDRRPTPVPYKVIQSSEPLFAVKGIPAVFAETPMGQFRDPLKRRG